MPANIESLSRFPRVGIVQRKELHRVIYPRSVLSGETNIRSYRVNLAWIEARALPG